LVPAPFRIRASEDNPHPAALFHASSTVDWHHAVISVGQEFYAVIASEIDSTRLLETLNPRDSRVWVCK
jgi:hypothetical protein